MRHEFTYEGAKYGISPRLAPDDYPTAAAREGVAIALANAVTYREVFADSASANRMLDYIAAVDFEGKRIPRPWPDWMDLPASIIDELTAFFFDDLLRKTKQSTTYASSTQWEKALELICETLTRWRGLSSPTTTQSTDSLDPTTSTAGTPDSVTP